MSAGDYVRDRRLLRAAALIRETKLKLADVAAAVGFCDQAHFSRAFKARFGTTPAAFRDNA
jgi:transcriptional regulator GlxA family with amidase domain